MFLLALTLSSPVVAQEYRYDPYGRRDPFERFFGDRGDSNPSEPTQLQRFEPDELELLGVVWGDEPMAMVQDPDHHVHVLSAGTYVGPRWGRVTAITREGVVVTEELLDSESRLVIRKHVLQFETGPAYDLGR
jgi:Tfp pilus assembly protein PilP